MPYAAWKRLVLTPTNLVIRTYPITATATGTDANINPTVLREIVCADLSAKRATAMAACHARSDSDDSRRASVCRSRQPRRCGAPDF